MFGQLSCMTNYCGVKAILKRKLMILSLKTSLRALGIALLLSASLSISIHVQAQPSNWPSGAPWPVTVKYNASQLSSSCSGVQTFTFSNNAVHYSYQFYGTYWSIQETVDNGTITLFAVNSSYGSVCGQQWVIQWLPNSQCNGGYFFGSWNAVNDIPLTPSTSSNSLGTNGIVDITTLSQGNCGNQLPALNCECLPNSFGCSATQTNVVCSGQSNGMASITVSGGESGNYGYSWSGGSTSTSSSAHNISGLAPGNYTVSVTRGSNSATCSLTIEEFSLATGVTQPSCGQSTGSITTSVDAGSGNYGYTWSGSVNNSTNANQYNLSPGQYCVTVTDNSAGCTASKCETINQASTSPPAGWPSGAPWPIRVIYKGSDFGTNCSGTYTYEFSGCIITTYQNFSSYYNLYDNFNGNAPDHLVFAQFGNGYIYFSISDGSGTSYQLYNFSFVYPTGLPSNGTIDLTNRSFFSQGPVQLNCTAPNYLPGSAASNPISCSATATKVDCDGAGTGEAVVDVTGGNTNSSYSYSWSSGSTSGGNNMTIGGLTGDVYTILVSQGSDQATCMVTITDAGPMVASVRQTSFGRPSSRPSGNTGFRSLILGGQTPHSFNWIGPSTSNDQHPMLQQGRYILEVRDNNGCEVTAGPFFLR